MNVERAVLGAAIVLLAATSARAQNAELLYDAGAYRLAADSFAARATSQPDVPAHWYNLGNALYHVGEDVGARVAWLRAARMGPRNATVRRALSLVPPPDAISADVTQVPVVTQGELLVLAAALWTIGWVMVVLRRRTRVVLIVLVVAAVLGAMGWSKAQAYHQAVALVRHDNTPMRAAPFASAGTRRAMSEGMSVDVLRAYAGWVLVERGKDRGWVQQNEIVPLTPLRPPGV